MPRTRTTSTVWWFLVPLLSLGFFTFAMTSSDPESRGVAYAVTSAMLMLLWLGGTGHVLALQIWASNRLPAAAPAPPVVHATDPAVVAAQWRMQRRQEARNLIATNPGLANELKIGRPELPGRSYDDGGLVDVNHVPAPWLAAQLEISAEAAQLIVDARSRVGGFSHPDELLVYCDGLTPERLNIFRDRLCFVPL